MDRNKIFDRIRGLKRQYKDHEYINKLKELAFEVGAGKYIEGSPNLTDKSEMEILSQIFQAVQAQCAVDMWETAKRSGKIMGVIAIISAGIALVSALAAWAAVIK